MQQKRLLPNANYNTLLNMTSLVPVLIDYIRCLGCGWQIPKPKGTEQMHRRCPECGSMPLQDVVIVRRETTIEIEKTETVETLINKDAQDGKCWKCGEPLIAKDYGLKCRRCGKVRLYKK